MAAKNDLFTNRDGTSMVFYMRPCAERQLMRPLINQYGGKITSNPVTANSTKLAEKGSIVSGDDYLSTKYVEECVKQNKLLDIEEFRIKPGTVASVDSLDNVEEISSDDSMSPADYITKMQSLETKGRNKYTKEEDLAIIHHLITQNLYRDAAGMKIWKDLEVFKVTNHTAQSMHTRYRKTILPNIHSYRIEHSWISKLTGVIVPKANASFNVDDMFKRKSPRKKSDNKTILDIPSTSHSSSACLRTDKKYQQLEFVTSSTDKKKDSGAIISKYFSSVNKTKTADTNTDPEDISADSPINGITQDTTGLIEKVTHKTTPIKGKQSKSTSTDDSWLKINVNADNSNNQSVTNRNKQSVTDKHKHSDKKDSISEKVQVRITQSMEDEETVVPTRVTHSKGNEETVVVIGNEIEKYLDNETLDSSKKSVTKVTKDSIPDNEAVRVTRHSTGSKRAVDDRSKGQSNSPKTYKDGRKLSGTGNNIPLTDKRKRKKLNDDSIIDSDGELHKKDKTGDKKAKNEEHTKEINIHLEKKTKKSYKDDGTELQRKNPKRNTTHTSNQISVSSSNEGDEEVEVDSEVDTEDFDDSDDGHEDITVHKDQYGPKTSTPKATRELVKPSREDTSSSEDELSDTDSVEECKELCKSISTKYDLHYETVRNIMYCSNGCLARTLSYIEWGPHSFYPPPWNEADDASLNDHEYVPSLCAKYGVKDVKDRLTFLGK